MSVLAASDETESDETESVETRSTDIGVQTQGQRLDRCLVGLASEFSRNHLQSLIERGCVRVDGRVETLPARKLRLGQHVEVELQPTAESQAFRAEAMDLDYVFEDEHLLVINKVAGMVVHPAAGNWTGTVMNGLLAQHRGATSLPRGGIVHRLDTDTSGLMVVGKTLEAVTALTRMIAAREVHREYLALVHGHLAAAAAGQGEVAGPWVIEAPLRRDPASRVKMAILASGKPARTDVYPLGEAAWQEGTGERALKLVISAVHCVLHSGRTHQIRVHLASRGHPLVSDALYGGLPALGLTRQALHAARLSFAHPISGESLSFSAALPGDLDRAWTSLGLDSAALALQ